MESGDRRVVDILRKKHIRPDSLYRLSVYTCPYSEGQVHLFYSTLTGAAMSLTDGEWAAAGDGGRIPVFGRTLEEAGLADLVRLCLLTEQDRDDYRLYETALTVLRTLSKEKPGVKTYTILPTTGCNARCPYCYEEGLPVKTMDDAAADRTAEFIARTGQEDGVVLSWFGGEPLLAARVISRICRRLNERGISYRSRIVTNGVLLTEALADEAVSLWKLERAQVSVDGERADYEARKRYLRPVEHNYDAMLRAVGLLLERDVQVTIRCNADRENVEGMRPFWEDIGARYGTYERLSLYTEILTQKKHDESCVALHRRILELEDEAAAGGLKMGRGEEPFRLKVNCCMADSRGKSVVIGPDGTLYRCEHLSDGDAFGSMYDEDAAIGEHRMARAEPDPACRDCRFLPECTAFFRNACPDWFEYCAAFRQFDLDRRLRRMAEGEARSR